MEHRHITQIIAGKATSDGAGVVLRRSIGRHQSMRLDPFLMLDAFSSDKAEDYIGGFPSHPHRGFETVTYMLDGHMLHEDHMGNRGHLKEGDVQWMTAGRGIIHSEMPQQEQGLLRGFQLWINLPSKEKMKAASYRDIPSDQIPVINYEDGIQIKIIAGSVPNQRGELMHGPIQGLSTEAIYLDIYLPAQRSLRYALPTEHQAFLYAYEGTLSAGDEASDTLKTHEAGILSHGSFVQLNSGDNDTRFLLIAGKPIGEPIAQYGPFVMNTQEEIDQAIKDYREGVLA